MIKILFNKISSCSIQHINVLSEISLQYMKAEVGRK